MKAVALGRSHFYHEQAQALSVISNRLWEQWQQKAKVLSPESEVRRPDSPTLDSGLRTIRLRTTSPDTASGRPLGPDGANSACARREELAFVEVERLRSHAVLNNVAMAGLIAELQPVVEPLARMKQVSLTVDVTDFTLPRTDPTMLRQAILNLITYALDVPRCEDVLVECAGNQKYLRISAQKRAGSSSVLNTHFRQGLGLEISRDLIHSLGGKLHLREDNDVWQAQLSWPHKETPILLVIDDNEQLFTLFQRFLAPYDWRLLSAHSGCEMRAILDHTIPAVIFLDVMMPQEDGWKLLVDMKQHEAARDVPVVICSVLNEPELARALGASAYLPKPVHQRDLLRVLSRWG
jgi:CheY-like chemotaxis protein